MAPNAKFRGGRRCPMAPAGEVSVVGAIAEGAGGVGLHCGAMGVGIPIESPRSGAMTVGRAFESPLAGAMTIGRPIETSPSGALPVASPSDAARAGSIAEGAASEAREPGAFDLGAARRRVAVGAATHRPGIEPGRRRACPMPPRRVLGPADRRGQRPGIRKVRG